MLWKHQSKAIDIARQCVLDKDTGKFLIQIPPGTGKTEIAARLAIDWSTSKNMRKALICVPNTRILGQFYERLVALTPHTIGVEQAGRAADPRARIVIASQMSLLGRLAKYPHDVLCIIDEAHHSNFDAPEFLRVARSFARVIGLTATPWSNGCDTIFGGAQRYFLSLSEATAAGLVCDFDVLPWTPPRGPYALVFCESNRDCQFHSDKTPDSDWIGVTRPAMRNLSAIMRWQTRELGILFVNKMLLEGFDSKACDAVWLNRVTQSDILLVQMCGRALRHQPGKRARIICSCHEMVERVLHALKRLDSPS